MSHVAKDGKKLVARVRRIAGQVAGLERALNGAADCGAVLHQIAAIRGAINGLMLQVLEGHLHEHVALADRRSQTELEPVMAIMRSYLK